MKQIDSFQTALKYVNNLGFATSGNIAYQQAALCSVTDALFDAAGKAYPFKVCYHRYTSPEGFTYPWLGSFDVNGKNGKTRVEMSQVKIK